MKNALLAVVAVLSLVGVASADPVGGGVCRTATAYSHSTNDFNISLYGGEATLITVRGDGDTDLDLFVYDENGNLVASDTSYSDQASVIVNPRWTGHFTIRVVNRGGVYNNFTVCAS